MRPINLIVIHCSATPPEQDIGRKELDRMHRQRGFLSIGYHLVIRRDGTVEQGRNFAHAGAHAEGHNAGSIGVCMVGGLATKALKPVNNFTPLQWSALEGCVLELRSMFPGVQVLGHRDLPNVHKECPCFDVKAWLKEKQL